MEWFRLYNEFADDPKVQSMTEAMQRRLVMLFCLRGKNALIGITDDELKVYLRISIRELSETKKLFLSKGFIDQDWQLQNWDKRQFKSDTSTERVREYRERKTKQDCNVTNIFGNVTETPPDTDTDTDTDTEKDNTPLSPRGESEAIDYQGVLDEYNLTCPKMPRAEKLSDDRRKSIRVRIKDYGREAITAVFQYASKSPHHNGQNDSGWTADFDWLMGPKNFRKMLERARSGTRPTPAAKPSRMSSIITGSKIFLEGQKHDTGNDGQNIHRGGSQLPATVYRR